jgi:hypothetical protein
MVSGSAICLGSGARNEQPFGRPSRFSNHAEATATTRELLPLTLPGEPTVGTPVPRVVYSKRCEQF